MQTKQSIIFGEVWNAKLATFDGRDYWLACFLTNWKFSHRAIDICDHGFDTQEEASAWLVKEGFRRGIIQDSETPYVFRVWCFPPRAQGSRRSGEERFHVRNDGSIKQITHGF